MVSGKDENMKALRLPGTKEYILLVEQNYTLILSDNEILKSLLSRIYTMFTAVFFKVKTLIFQSTLLFLKMKCNEEIHT